MSLICLILGKLVVEAVAWRHAVPGHHLRSVEHLQATGRQHSEDGAGRKAHDAPPAVDT